VKWQKSEDIPDDAIKKTIEDFERGIFRANLGGNVFKLDVARPGQSKSRGFRTIVAVKKSDGKYFFLYGFPKSSRANIDESEEALFKDIADDYSNMSDTDINQLVQDKKLFKNG